MEKKFGLIKIKWVLRIKQKYYVSAVLNLIYLICLAVNLMIKGSRGEEMAEIIMYVIVNKDIKMSPGKLAAQVAHSAVKASHLGQIKEEDWWEQWNKGSYTKIILKASEFEMKEIMKNFPECTVFTYDEGRTEIPKGTLTTLAFIPMPRDDMRILGVVSKMKLY